MNPVIKIAKTTQEIDHVFGLRYNVMVEEEKYLPKNNDARLYDLFDALPSTINYIAYVGEVPVGTIRFTKWSCVGMPSEKYFDFERHLPHYDQRVFSGSMLCIKKEYRKIQHLAKFLVWMGVIFAKKDGLTHLLAPINPVAKSLFLRMGFVVIDTSSITSEEGLPVVPMVLDITKLEDDYLSAKFKETYYY